MKIFSKKICALLSAGVLCCAVLCACHANSDGSAPSAAAAAQSSADNAAAHADIQAVADDYIQPRREKMEAHLGETPLSAENDYEYIADAANKGLWIGTKGSFQDDREDKVWFFYDENRKVYFIYRHIDSNEFRYYIHDDQVILYTVGAPGDGQVSYYRGDSNFDTSSDNIVHQAEVALHTVENVADPLW